MSTYNYPFSSMILIKATLRNYLRKDVQHLLKFTNYDPRIDLLIGKIQQQISQKPIYSKHVIFFQIFLF